MNATTARILSDLEDRREADETEAEFLKRSLDALEDGECIADLWPEATQEEVEEAYAILEKRMDAEAAK